MEIHLESTAKLVELNGVQVRIWEGHTESGIPIHAYVALVAVDRDADCTEFARELQERLPRDPSPTVAVIPSRMIL